ncbi:MAG TPA: SgcJ/EcaC family oxidoreductase [Gemmatimonadales bacterium]|nr:SgcJ/EcaC family oxidoreductase [Gemmatimonadales bacterium]
MRPWTIAAVLLVAHGTVLGAQTPPDSAVRADVRKAIDRGNAEYIAALGRADAGALAKVYAPDGARMGEHGAFAQGRAAIAAMVRDLLHGTGPITVTVETVDLWVVHDLAYETGKWRYTFTPPQKSTQSVGGRYLTVWQRQPEGGWRIIADMGIPGTGG